MPRRRKSETGGEHPEARSTVLPPIRVSPEEKARLEAAAARAGVSLSEWLRSLGMREAQ